MSTNTITPLFPIKENEDGKYEVYGITDLTKVVDQNLKMLLLTRPGEWIGRPAFGVGLHNYLFENQYTIELGTNERPALRDNILSQVSAYIEYITIQDLQISSSENTLSIRLKYFINDSGAASTLDLTINETNSNY